MPCSFPRAQPRGAPAGSAVRLRLVPLGPLAKIRKVFPAFAEPNSKKASIRFGLRICHFDDRTLWLGSFLSTANTEVTFGEPSPRMKHEPGTRRFWPIEQLPVEGVAEMITGARSPS